MANVSVPVVYLIIIAYEDGGKPSHHHVPVDVIPASLLRRMDATSRDEKTEWYALLAEELHLDLERDFGDLEAYHDELIIGNQLQETKDMLMVVRATYGFSS
jgi:hypothetical protein